MVRHNVQLVQDVGYNIPSAGNDGLIELRQEVGGQDSLIVLGETGLQAKIEFAPRHGLGKQIPGAFLIGRTLVRRKPRQGLGQAISESNFVAKARQLLGPDFHGNLNASFPAPLLDVEHTGLDARFLLHRLRPKEQRDPIGCEFG